MLLKEICSFSKGLQVKRDLTSTDYDIPYLHYGDLYKKYNVNLKLNEEYNKIIKVNRDCYNVRYQIDNNNIVMNLTSENYDDLGKCVIIKNPKNTPFIAGMETHLIKIHSQLIIPEYLNYYFESSSFLQTIHQFITGMKVFRVKPDDILNIDITLPNLRYQQHIVDIIGSIDDKIENNQKLIDKLYEYLNLQMKKLAYNKEKIQIYTNDEISIANSGIDKFTGEKIYLDTSSVIGNSIIDNSYKVSYSNRPSRANMTPQDNTVWIAKLKNSPKHIIVKSYCDDLKNKYIFSTGFLGIKISKESFNLLSTYFISEAFEKEKDNLSVGATMQSINNATFKNMYIPKFKNNDYIQFNKIAENIFKLIYKLDIEKNKLYKLKKTYLAKFF